MSAPARSVLAALLLGAACSKPTAVPCVSSSDCAPGERCESGRCAAVSAADAAIADAAPVDAALDAGVGDGGAHDAGCSGAILVEGGLSYCTVEAALAAAPPGAVVRLPAGRVVAAPVLTAAVTLVGQGSIAGGTVLAPPAGSAAGILVQAANVTVSALVVEGAPGDGVRFEAQGRLQDVEIRGALGPAIRVGGAGIAQLSLVRVDGTGAGADVPGVLLESGSTTDIDGASIAASGGGGVRCEGCTLRAARAQIDRSGGIGLEITGAADVTLGPSVRVSGSRFGGIQVFDSALVMRDSESSSNGPAGSTLEDGLWLASPTQAVVERNIFTANRAYGIYCSAGVVVNACSGNSLAGNNGGATNCAACQ